MKSIEIGNIKKFTSALFVGGDFDTFCVAEASMSTLINVTIDGHTNPEFLKTEDGTVPDISPIIKWSEIKSLCYDVIKGTRLPLKFRIILMVPEAKVGSFITNAGLDIRPEEVGTLALNIRYEAGKLTCITGTSLKAFRPDKTLEEAWDASMMKFLGRFA